MVCPACQTDLSNDASSCFVCGWEPEGIVVRVRGWQPEAELPNAAYFERMERRQAGLKRFAEGRGLEEAGDIAAALACYEELVASGFDLQYPYERLAIMYRKARRPLDEERVVRAALAAIGASVKQKWFSARLAKLMVQRGLRELTE
ncbi:MAG: hypothetical protein JNL44_09935 [Gemmatimonadetes bacterium]|nr:hypothetical protein [Gemmatimonadota bacterium]